MFVVHIIKTVRTYHITFNKGNLFPQRLIQVTHQGCHKGIIGIAKCFILALFYNLNLIGIRFFHIKGTDTLDDLVTGRVRR